MGWLVLARPISFYWCAGNSVPKCGVSTGYAQEVLAIGTPLIWWGGTLALLFCLGWWLPAWWVTWSSAVPPGGTGGQARCYSA